MANKSSVTRTAAMDYALRVIRAYEPNADVEEVISKLAVQFAKRPVKPEGPSKAALENARLATLTLEKANATGEHRVTAAWMRDNVPGINSTQKAAAVAKAAGFLRVYEGKNVFYNLV